MERGIARGRLNRRIIAGWWKRSGRDVVESSGREMTLAIIDDVWSDYLANVAELRGSVIWTSWAVTTDPVRQMIAGGTEFGEPLQKFLQGELKIYEDFQKLVPEGIAEAFATATVRDGRIEFQGAERLERGATWTYVTSDQLLRNFHRTSHQKIAGDAFKKTATGLNYSDSRSSLPVLSPNRGASTPIRSSIATNRSAIGVPVA